MWLTSIVVSVNAVGVIYQNRTSGQREFARNLFGTVTIEEMTRKVTQALPPIRRGNPAEAASLTALTVRSKAYWGYDAAFMKAAEAELIFDPKRFAPHFLVFVVEAEGEYLGFSSLIPSSQSSVELHDLFVDPNHMGRGIGTLLWEHAVETTRGLGYRRMTLTADPNAERFYLKRGALITGFRESGLEAGRMLPEMEYHIDQDS